MDLAVVCRQRGRQVAGKGTMPELRENGEKCVRMEEPGRKRAVFSLGLGEVSRAIECSGDTCTCV